MMISQFSQKIVVITLTPVWKSHIRYYKQKLDRFLQKNKFLSIKATTLHIPWRDSISRLIAPVSSEKGGDNTIRPRRQEHN
jgi:hypothetical protein